MFDDDRWEVFPLPIPVPELLLNACLSEGLASSRVRVWEFSYIILKKRQYRRVYYREDIMPSPKASMAEFTIFDII